MTGPDSNQSRNSSPSTASQKGFAFIQQLKGKRISYLTLPLLFMATVTEFVILATGWKYQQVVCLPQGMGVTFFGIGPIGATILAVELLKLPLAIWTASRAGWQKGFMLFVGLPLICVLTFQLVKDMAVYEMGVAMTPASQYLEKATIEETKIAQLNGELTAIEGKKTDREKKLVELTAKQGKAKADLEELRKVNEAARQDAINLTEYQKKEFSDVSARQQAITTQFNADTDQINKTLAELRTRRETELGRATKWNAEEARIENAYKVKMADYTNQKKAYDKAKAEYDGAGMLKRQLLKEPIDPGVPPVREENTILKPTMVADIEAQIKAKEAEMTAVNNRRRDLLAQVDADARRLRDDYDKRSGSKREEADKKREELTAAQSALAAEMKSEQKQIDQDLAPAIQKIDGIRGELDAARKRAEGFYEAREASIRNTQVHRIATTVEIVRGLIRGERPMSVKATAKERGDILTDQISMVRIWVYPVLAFIVAFLPTLMVEIGFSTVFHPEEKRPAYRLGFMGRRLHWLYTRAGRQKIFRAERLCSEANTKLVVANRTLAATKSSADQAIRQKDAELQAAHDALNSAKATHDEQFNQLDADHTERLRTKEEAWGVKCAVLTESVNRAVAEKEAALDHQQSEIDRQVQARQNAFNERLARIQQELDTTRATNEAERTAILQDHQNKLIAVTEDCKAQVFQIRRQLSDAELAAAAKVSKMEQELKDALHNRGLVEAQIKNQAETHTQKVSQEKENTARELERMAHQEKQRLDRQKLEFEKTLRLRHDAFEQKLKQREQELQLAFETRLAEEKSKAEQDLRFHELERERQLEARVREVEATWHQSAQQRDDAAQAMVRQREQQLQAQAEARLRGIQAKSEEQLRNREVEFERQRDTLNRAAEKRLKEELQKRDLEVQEKLKQRELEIAAKADARINELQKEWAADLRAREEDWERRTASRVRDAETRAANQEHQNEESFQVKLRQRDQQWQVKLDAARTEAQALVDDAVRRRTAEADAAMRELEVQLRNEIKLVNEANLGKIKQREQEMAVELAAQSEARRMADKATWQAETEIKVRTAVEPVKVLLARAEKERDEARQASVENTRHVQDLEKKLTEASSFLNAWRNGKPTSVS